MDVDVSGDAGKARVVRLADFRFDRRPEVSEDGSCFALMPMTTALATAVVCRRRINDSGVVTSTATAFAKLEGKDSDCETGSDVTVSLPVDGLILRRFATLDILPV